MIDSRHIGFSTRPSTMMIDRWRVQLFCEAIGETDPIYLDEAVARNAGHPSCPVPPTFLRALEADHFSAAEILKILEIPVLSVLHAEQSFIYHATAHVGESIEVTRTLTDSYDKRGGALTFIVLESHFRRAGETICGSRQVIAVRNSKE
jgi:hypothetical protein